VSTSNLPLHGDVIRNDQVQVFFFVTWLCLIDKIMRLSRKTDHQPIPLFLDTSARMSVSSNTIALRHPSFFAFLRANLLRLKSATAAVMIRIVTEKFSLPARAISTDVLTSATHPERVSESGRSA